jgi:hypothetical protein
MKKLDKLIAKLREEASSRPPIARHASQRLAAKWIKIQHGRMAPFDNKAHSKVFENVVSDEMRAHLRNSVTVRTREIKRIRSLIGIGAEADVLIEPKNLRRKPVAIVSCKMTLAPESLKECIGEAYALTKLFKHHKLGLRYYLVATHRYHYKSEAQANEIDEFAKVSKRYLQGIYTLTNKPFIDQLVYELKATYR